MGRSSLKTVDCPVARPLDASGEWWSLLIVPVGFRAGVRFRQLQIRLGVTGDILTVRLGEFLTDRILDLGLVLTGPVVLGPLF